jgi:K+-transporting ATPase A subunit
VGKKEGAALPLFSKYLAFYLFPLFFNIIIIIIIIITKKKLIIIVIIITIKMRRKKIKKNGQKDTRTKNSQMRYFKILFFRIFLEK